MDTVQFSNASTLIMETPSTNSLQQANKLLTLLFGSDSTTIDTINQCKQYDLTEEIQALKFLSSMVSFPGKVMKCDSLKLLILQLNAIVEFIGGRKLHKSVKQLKLILVEVANIISIKHFWICFTNIQSKLIKWNAIHQHSLRSLFEEDFDSEDFKYWTEKFAVIGIKILSLFASWKTNSWIIGNGVPIILWSQTNSRHCAFHIACLGTSWSDRDFPQENSLQYFQWTKQVFQEWNNGNRLEAATKWFQECSQYFNNNKPCWKWFNRMLLLLRTLQNHWQGINRHNLPFNVSFWDYVPLPTKAFGKIPVDVKQQLLNHGFPICFELLKQIDEENTPRLLMVIHSRTHGTATTAPLTSLNLRSIEDIQVFEKEGTKIHWNSLRMLFVVKEEQWLTRHNMYAVKVTLPFRPKGNDWIIISQGWNQYFHPLISHGRLHSVAAAFVKLIYETQ